jgi:hypothetical protein
MCSQAVKLRAELHRSELGTEVMAECSVVVFL